MRGYFSFEETGTGGGEPWRKGLPRPMWGKRDEPPKKFLNREEPGKGGKGPNQRSKKDITSTKK